MPEKQVIAWQCTEHDHLSVENRCPECKRERDEIARRYANLIFHGVWESTPQVNRRP